MKRNSTKWQLIKHTKVNFIKRYPVTAVSSTSSQKKINLGICDVKKKNPKSRAAGK